MRIFGRGIFGRGIGDTANATGPVLRCGERPGDGLTGASRAADRGGELQGLSDGRGSLPGQDFDDDRRVVGGYGRVRGERYGAAIAGCRCATSPPAEGAQDRGGRRLQRNGRAGGVTAGEGAGSAARTVDVQRRDGDGHAGGRTGGLNGEVIESWRWRSAGVVGDTGAGHEKHAAGACKHARQRLDVNAHAPPMDHIVYLLAGKPGTESI
jgi:hypothetical protein